MVTGTPAPINKPTPLGLLAAVASPLLSAVATVCLAASMSHTHGGQGFSVVAAFALGSFIGPLFTLMTLRFSYERHPFRSSERKWEIFEMVLLRGAIGGLLFMYGVAHTSAAKAVFFTKIEPYFVLLWAWILRGEKISKQELVLLTVHIGGAILLSTSGDLSTLGSAQLGDLLIILSMCVGGYSYPKASQLGRDIGPRVATIWIYGCCGVVGLCGLLLFRGTAAFHASQINYHFLFSHAILFYAIAAPIWFVALKSVPHWLVSALRACGPFAGIPAAYFIMGEKLDWIQMVGGLVVIATSAWMVQASRKEGR